MEENTKQHDTIILKWGTLKAWDLHTPKVVELLKKYKSAMTKHDTLEQKEIICQMIDECNVETIYLAWDEKNVTKEEAKKYVMEYRNKTTSSYRRMFISYE